MRRFGGLLGAGVILLAMTPSTARLDAVPMEAAATVDAAQAPEVSWSMAEADREPWWAGVTQSSLSRARSCANKRTDACGCHHYFGVRHCHPKLKTDRCQRRVQRAPAPGTASDQPQLAAATAGER